MVKGPPSVPRYRPFGFQEGLQAGKNELSQKTSRHRNLHHRLGPHPQVAKGFLGRQAIVHFGQRPFDPEFEFKFEFYFRPALLAASDHGVVTVDLPRSARAPLRPGARLTLYKSHAHPPSCV